MSGRISSVAGRIVPVLLLGLVAAGAAGCSSSCTGDPATDSKLRTWLQDSLQLNGRNTFSSAVDAARAFADVFPPLQQRTLDALSLQAAIRQWVSAFNSELQAKVNGDGRVALVDFYSDFSDEIAHPASYGLTNVTTPACPITGLDTSGLPTYNFAVCTTAALDASPPSGLTAGWWQTYAFSDSFHPTPFGHHLLAASVSRAIARAGWL